MARAKIKPASVGLIKKGTRIDKLLADNAEAERFGPAMEALTDKQRNFVIEVLRRGTGDFTGAAIAAGYGTDTTSMNAMYVTAHRLMASESVKAAFKEEAVRRLNVYSVLSVGVVAEIMLDAEAPQKVRLDAAKAVMDRTGLVPKIEHEHKLTVTVDAKIKKAVALARSIGMNPAEILGTIGIDYVDAEYEVID